MTIPISCWSTTGMNSTSSPAPQCATKCSTSIGMSSRRWRKGRHFDRRHVSAIEQVGATLAFPAEVLPLLVISCYSLPPGRTLPARESRSLQCTTNPRRQLALYRHERLQTRHEDSTNARRQRELRRSRNGVRGVHQKAVKSGARTSKPEIDLSNE